MSNVIVFGSMNMDLSIEAPRVPAAGETLEGGNFITNPGGKGANQAVAAARLGAPVTMVAALARDIFGEVLIGCLEGAGINTDEVKICEDEPTGTAVIVRVDGDNRIVLGHGANFSMDVDEVCGAIDSASEPGDIFLCQFECEGEVTAQALEHAHGRGLFTMVNPAPAREIPEALWPSIDYLCMNETECAAITGDYPFGPEDASVAAHKIAARGVSQVVVTLGDKGSYGLDGDEEWFVPSRKVVAVDTTAAGDTFIGAMIAARTLGMGFKEAMEFATVASSITVTRVGAQQSIPSLSEVQQNR